jgi:6-phosphogluconolactonase
MERRHFIGMGLSMALFAPVALAKNIGRCVGPACGGMVVYIGTQGSGSRQGIIAGRLDPATGALASLGIAAEVERPTWLVPDPHKPVLYVVSETGNYGQSQGGVLGLAVDRVSCMLRLLGRSNSGGGGAMHLSYDAPSRTLFVANYGTGQVATLAVKVDGTPEGVRSIQAHAGSGPHRRQKGPHAHAAVLDPSRRFLLSPDLGADRLFVYHFDAVWRTLAPAATPFLTFPPGSGPRHLTFSPDGRFAFLDTELTGEVYAYRWDAWRGALTQTARIALDGPDFAETRSASEVMVSLDGRFL